MKVLHKGVKSVLLNGVAHVLHQLQVVMQVVHRVQVGTQHFFDELFGVGARLRRHFIVDSYQ